MARVQIGGGDELTIDVSADEQSVHLKLRGRLTTESAGADVGRVQIVGVTPGVYDQLERTGITRLLQVRRRLPLLDPRVN